MSEEENLPSAEEMRARYADLMKDDAPAADESAVRSPQSAEESAVDSPQSAEPEPEAVAAEPEATPEPEPSNLQSPIPGLPAEPEPELADPAEDLAAHLLDVNVRLWAELGRSQLPLAQAVALGAGAIVDLDKEPEDEVDIYVNGMPFATGKLLLVDEEWAIRLERIVATPHAVEQASSSGSGA
jgi:flagellar motor switch protein FliN/FliY